MRRQMSRPYVEREERFAEWFGWRPSEAVECPRYAARKRCQLNADVTCVCEEYCNLLDHPAVWRSRGGEHVYTAEPYDTAVDLDELARFAAEVRRDGLHVCLSPRSGWFPGATLLIIVRQSAGPYS